MNIITGKENEQYIWDKESGALKKVLVQESTVSENKDTMFGLNITELKLLLTELKIPLYLIGAGLAVILLIILLERRTK